MKGGRIGLMGIGVAMLLGVVPGASARAVAAVQLRCPGVGAATRNEITDPPKEPKDERVPESKKLADSGKRTFRGVAWISIGPRAAKIHVPAQMLPKLNSAPDDGWLEIKDLEVSRRELQGGLSFNFVNKPSLTLDRISGDLSIEASGATFSGACHRVWPRG
jgi:hypothetical protein